MQYIQSQYKQEESVRKLIPHWSQEPLSQLLQGQVYGAVILGSGVTYASPSSQSPLHLTRGLWAKKHLEKSEYLS